MSDDMDTIRHKLLITHLQALDNKEVLEPDPDCPMCTLAAFARASAFEEAAKIVDDAALKAKFEIYDRGAEEICVKAAAAIREHARK